MLSRSSRDSERQLPPPRSCWLIVLTAGLGCLGHLVAVTYSSYKRAGFLSWGLVLGMLTVPVLVILLAQWVMLISSVLIASSLLTRSILQCQAVQVLLYVCMVGIRNSKFN
jgi:CHASE2 domain-containing sensor protein